MWFRSLFTSQTDRKARRSRNRRLRFEALEDRAVPAFLSPVDYFVGREAVVADFNNDNVQDLAVASGVLLGNGDGTFGAVIRSTFGNSPQALAVGDFNADGKLDLAAGDRSTNDLTVLLGNGDGSFSAPHTIAIGSVVTGVAVGDFNVDGRLDLGLASRVFIPEVFDPESGQWMGHYEGYATVLLGNGNGSFAAPATTPLGAVGYAYYAAVVDFNGDGNLDLATSNIVLLGDGAGNFPDTTPGYGYGSSPYHLVYGDFNRDGILDMGSVAADGSSNNVTVRRGVGDGGYFAAENFATGPRPASLAMGDFNGDGWLDLVAAGDFSGRGTVLINDQNWPLPPQPYVWVDDTGVQEGNTGTVTATFTVNLSGAYFQPVSVHYATADGDATVADGDYQPVADTLLTFAPGETTKTITVLVNGDRVIEGTLPWLSEEFSVHLSSPMNTY